MILPSLVGHIVELAERIEKNTRPADHIVGEFLRTRKYLGSHDRGFISQSVYGMLRFRGRLAILLQHYCTENPSASDGIESRKFLPHYVAYAVAIEEANPQQIISTLTPHWETILPTIDLSQFTSWLARNKSLDFLVGDEIQQLAGWYSFQEWMVREWVDQFGMEETEDLLHALNHEAPTTLRVNTLKIAVEDCQTRLRKEGIGTKRTQYSPAGLLTAKRFNAHAFTAFKKGLFEVQDEGSQIICCLVDPQPGEFVIDACAGAGGKVLMMAELMKNTGEILAFDVESNRLRELEKRVSHSGITIAVSKPSGAIHPENLRGKADRVLVDAPCSGVGTIRRNPTLKWSVSEKFVSHYAEIQSTILERSAPYVKRGGTLVYATCSLFRKENEEIVENFLSSHSEFQPAIPTRILSQLGIEVPTDLPYLKLLPHRHGTDGFFVAVLKRNQ